MSQGGQGYPQQQSYPQQQGYLQQRSPQPYQPQPQTKIGTQGPAQWPGMGNAQGVQQPGAASNWQATPQLAGQGLLDMQKAQATGNGAGFTNAQINAYGVGGQFYDPAALMDAYRATGINNQGDNGIFLENLKKQLASQGQ